MVGTVLQVAILGSVRHGGVGILSSGRGDLLGADSRAAIIAEDDSIDWKCGFSCR